MKPLYLSLCVLCSISMFSQSIYVEYEYSVEQPNLSSYKVFATLLAKSEVSLYTLYLNDVKHANTYNDIIETVGEDGIPIFTKNYFAETGDIGLTLMKKSNDTIKQAYQYYGENVIINDTSAKFEWEILEDTKQINSFKCFKAVTQFRGREFTAWFTNDIPISFGPNKFHGLPGLILSVYDKEESFQWHATLVKYPISIENEASTFSIPNEGSYTKYSLREHVDQQVDRAINRSKISRSKMPKGSSVLETKIERTGLELVYDWEVDLQDITVKD